eukprot:5273286-Karenia_brevis.AAC.1
MHRDERASVQAGLLQRRVDEIGAALTAPADRPSASSRLADVAERVRRRILQAEAGSAGDDCC